MAHRRKQYRPTDPRTAAGIRLLSTGEAMRLQIVVDRVRRGMNQRDLPHKGWC